MFSCEIYEISKNTLFTKHLCATASVNSNALRSQINGIKVFDSENSIFKYRMCFLLTPKKNSILFVCRRNEVNMFALTTTMTYFVFIFRGPFLSLAPGIIHLTLRDFKNHC